MGTEAAKCGGPWGSPVFRVGQGRAVLWGRGCGSGDLKDTGGQQEKVTACRELAAACTELAAACRAGRRVQGAARAMACILLIKSSSVLPPDVASASTSNNGECREAQLTEAPRGAGSALGLRAQVVRS